jgi:hypothetical protein
MTMRSFVRVDATGNITATLQSERTPGADPDALPDGYMEVTDRDPRDWHLYQWTGTDFVERDDLNAD